MNKSHIVTGVRRVVRISIANATIDSPLPYYKERQGAGGIVSP